MFDGFPGGSGGEDGQSGQGGVNPDAIRQAVNRLTTAGKAELRKRLAAFSQKGATKPPAPTGRGKGGFKSMMRSGKRGGGGR